MTIEEMILEDIEKIPRQQQSDLQKKYIEVYKEKELYRYEMVDKERKIEKWKKAYEKLNDKRNNTIEYLRQLKQNAPDEQALDKAISMLERKK